jgi:hypothetical protein
MEILAVQNAKESNHKSGVLTVNKGIYAKCKYFFTVNKLEKK